MSRWRMIWFMAAALTMAASPAHARIVISIDTGAQRMSVEVDGAAHWTWPVSTGRPGYRTPKGSYTAFRLERTHFSREWDDAPMPHSIFFTRRGHAIHGSYETKRLGRPVSHGCVRLHPVNAARLFRLVESRGVTDATVIVK
jgi:lipoprotein-anchoring transpeptidase ErfK/SrfK